MPDFALAPYILAMTGASVLIALVARLPLALKRCPCPADYLRRPRDGDTQPTANRPAPSTDGLSGDHRALRRLAKRHGLRRASELDPFVEPGLAASLRRAAARPRVCRDRRGDGVPSRVKHLRNRHCRLRWRERGLLLGDSGEPEDAFSPFNIRLRVIGPARVAGHPNFSPL